MSRHRFHCNVIFSLLPGLLLCSLAQAKGSLGRSGIKKAHGNRFSPSLCLRPLCRVTMEDFFAAAAVFSVRWIWVYRVKFPRVMIFNDTILPSARMQEEWRKKTRRVINDFPSQCHTAFTAEEKICWSRLWSAAKWLRRKHQKKRGGMANVVVFYFLRE